MSNPMRRVPNHRPDPRPCKPLNRMIPPRPPAPNCPLPNKPEPPPVNQSRLEELAEQILEELRLQKDDGVPDFSVGKVVAAVVMVSSLAAFVYAGLNMSDRPVRDSALMLAIALQTLVISLLIM